MKISCPMMPRGLAKLARQVSRNDDSDINELLSTSLSELFPEDRKAGKLDENTNHTNRTRESTERDMSEDGSSEFYQADYLQKLVSFEQDEYGESCVIENNEDSDSQSLIFQDIFPECQPGVDDSFALELEESFAQVVCDVDVRSLRREQRKRVIKTFFGPMKSLVKPVKIPTIKIPRIKSPTHFPAVDFRNNKRSRVTFADTPTYIVEDTEEALDEETSEGHFEEIESTWYNDLEYDDMKQSVLKTMEKIVRLKKRKRVFPENEYQTARGLELFTKETIVERKLYKVNSRHAVFDEQEEQRLAHKYDPERIRDLYVEATIKARDKALEYGWKDQEAIHELNEESVCITKEDTHF